MEILTRTSFGPGVGREIPVFKERESKPDSVLVHALKEDGRAMAVAVEIQAKLLKIYRGE